MAAGVTGDCGAGPLWPALVLGPVFQRAGGAPTDGSAAREGAAGGGELGGAEDGDGAEAPEAAAVAG
ncbi:hypothetical protein, partial [Arthrobacter sp. CAL618]|uniref:hypothetical protein n=1 Tax=Arthrobacter sp. CAL618 TaxID=1055770 RepID=UPI00055024A8